MPDSGAGDYIGLPTFRNLLQHMHPAARQWCCVLRCRRFSKLVARKGTLAMGIGRRLVDPSLPQGANRDSDLLDQEHICASFNSKWGHMKSLVNRSGHKRWHICVNSIAHRVVSQGEVPGHMSLSGQGPQHYSELKLMLQISCNPAVDGPQKSGFHALSNAFSGAHLPLHPLSLATSPISQSLHPPRL